MLHYSEGVGGLSVVMVAARKSYDSSTGRARRAVRQQGGWRLPVGQTNRNVRFPNQASHPTQRLVYHTSNVFQVCLLNHGSIQCYILVYIMDLIILLHFAEF